jgi:outer membrane receptor for ferric coprogen and ferric-rhodotorulic acid
MRHYPFHQQGTVMSSYASQYAHRKATPAQPPRLRPVTLAIQLLLAGNLVWAASYIPHAHAQSTVPQAERTLRTYAIEAGALSDVLTRFAGEAGIFLAGSGQLTQGLESRGLRGDYTAEGGLRSLLQNTGIEAVRQPSGQFVLQKVVLSEQALPEVSVQAQHESITEGSGSYTTGKMATATGLSLSQRQTPQSISVISRQQMDDFDLTTLKEVAQATPGIYTKGQAISDQEVTYFARGFALNHVNVDGLPLDVTGFNERNVAADMLMYDRVEVVRGATGLMEGAGAPAGSINLVRKRPVAEPLFNASVALGSWNNKQLTIDMSRALNASGSVRGRIAASTSDSDSFVDVTNVKNNTVYGIVEADLTPNTTLDVGFSTQRTRTDGVFTGLPTFADGAQMHLPRSTFLDKADTFQNRDNDVLFADLEHRFTGGWRAKFAMTHIKANSESRNTTNSRVTGQPYQIKQSETGWAYSTRQIVADMRASGPFSLLGRDHELVIGASYRNDVSDAKQTWESADSTINIGNWNPSTPMVGGSAAPYNWDRKINEKGIYSTANFSLTDPLHLIVGARLSWYSSDTTGWYGVTPTWRRSLEEDAVFAPYIGLVYDVDQHHSVYASATEIFQPQSVLDKNGDTLKPVTGTNYELGIKGEYFDGKLNTSAAIFKIMQINRPVRDEVGCPSTGPTSCSRAAGEVESEGVDLQVSGSPLPGWQIAGGYTYVMAKYTKDANPRNIGQRIATDEPRHLFKLFTNYRLPGALSKWNVGGSVYAQNKVYRSETGFNTAQGSYAVFGLAAGYKINDNLQLRLNIDNLFDRNYYQALGYSWAASQTRYGTPRNFMLTLNYKM